MGLVNLISKTYAALKFNHADQGHIAVLQQRLLRSLLKHAATHSEFYRELYEGIDTSNCPLSDLPVVTKSVMMDNFDRLVTDKRLKLQEIQNWMQEKKSDGKKYLGEFIPIGTSGSSGVTALIVYHRKALELVQANLFARSSLMSKKLTLYDFTKMLAHLLLGRKVRIAGVCVPRGSVHVMLRTLPPLHRLFTKSKLISSLISTHQIVKELNEFQPDILVSYSFLIALLAQEQLAGRLNIHLNHPASSVSGGGEPVTEHTQRLTQMAWSRNLHNIYASSECWAMATSCQGFDRLHVMSNLCILEVVDHAYNPVPRGQYGEKLLLTNLFNFVQPIIRYEIEDVIGYANKSCGCGSSLPTLMPVRGRITELIYFQKAEGGYERVHPFTFIVPLYYMQDLRQYQIVQTARNELAFYYVPQSDDVDIEKQLAQTLQEALAQVDLERLVKLKLKRVESISRDKQSGKFEMIKSMGIPSDINTAQ
jgi:phenylacetate-coenzyme A ligase PaaK-like adenylate-forming protein